MAHSPEVNEEINEADSGNKIKIGPEEYEKDGHEIKKPADLMLTGQREENSQSLQEAEEE